MKKLILIFILVANSIEAQQWIDKKYSFETLYNIHYGEAINFTGTKDSLALDLYLPLCSDPTKNNKRPLLIWLYGGAFVAGSKEDPSIVDHCIQFAKRGYVTASVNYRLGIVSDDRSWKCNYPNYSCVFATDSAEWIRSYYRAVQDVKGAVRYLVNRNELYNIDVDNIFIAGESAGAFTALGVALLDTISEKPAQAFQLSDVPSPHPDSYSCVYNKKYKFTTAKIQRPDLGSIDGDIEPTNINYTIKAVGNMFGGMPLDLLKAHSYNKIKPAIYTFHQRCDIIVSIDSNYMNWGLSWCLTHGYNCYGIINNNNMLYGGRVFSEWNTKNNYGYHIQNEFASVDFPYSFLLGKGSCTDQINYPCHAYDNKSLRENNLANFFAPYVTTSPICEPVKVANQDIKSNYADVEFHFSSVQKSVKLKWSTSNIKSIALFNTFGQELLRKSTDPNSDQITLDLRSLSPGIYFLNILSENKSILSKKIIVEF